ncbi:beta strand repeat-containing protein [Thetidibacter halocola]|uniref:Pentraxin (PTX) domain-containing protein n=1 Tax=Thetidibacter halocola TaxID=2827239 RepID=A0A8J7WDJ0_9RHOB|nr:hypothetical protein [Thetidibacter halocola]MBS0124454.1 hypothetical protein [Thetidibacter halocola]
MLDFKVAAALPAERTGFSLWIERPGLPLWRMGSERRDTTLATQTSTLAMDSALRGLWSGGRDAVPPVVDRTDAALPSIVTREPQPEETSEAVPRYALSHSTVEGDTNFPTELHELEHNIERSITNVDDLGDKAEIAEALMKVSRKTLEQVVQLEKQADSFLSTVKSFRFTLKVTEKVGPLKVPSKLFDRVLERVEEVATHVTFRAGQLREKIENGQYIDKLQQAEDFLDNAGKVLEQVETELKEYYVTIQLAQLVFENDGGAFDGLEATFDSALATVGINDALDAVNTLYESLVVDFNGLIASFDAPSLPGVNVFDAIGDVSAQFGQINGALSFISNPLKAVHAALKPIEWALDLVGFIFDITVGPVIDWILETLGISAIMDRIGDRITDFLPDLGIFDEVTGRIDAVLDEVQALIDEWSAQIDQIVADLRTQLLEQFEAASGFALRFGTNASEALDGRDVQGDILNALDGDDTVDGAPGGTAGNASDLFVASGGKDVLFGGDSGSDWLLLPGQLSRFTFIKVSESAPLVIYDKGGKYGFEIVYGIENFAFLDGFYDLDGLIQAGVVQTGGTPGNDVLIGSAENELFVHTAGQDSIDGSGEVYTGVVPDPADGGTDTWLLEDDPSSSSTTSIFLYSESGYNDGAASPKIWEGRALVGGSANSDYLNSIEDVVIQDNRNVSVFGSERANFIQANDSDDYLTGEGGDDLILGGGGRDLIIGGPGADRIFGEAGNDTLIGGPSTGEADHYDGGAGLDSLIYSNNTVQYDIVPPTGFTIVNGSLPATGRLRIDAEARTVQHMTADLSAVIATDTFVDIETIVGSDRDDTIRGADSGDDSLTIDGGGGDDILYSDGATRIAGGFGDDTLYSTADRGDFDGGTGIDTLDLRGYTDVRWSLENLFGAGMDLRAVESQDTEALVDAEGIPSAVAVPSTIFSGDADNIEVFLLGDGDDNLFDKGRGSYTVYGGAGDDVLIRRQANDGSHTNVLYGEDGNDYLELIEESGSLYGGEGDDTLRAAISGMESDVEGGDGDDLIYLQRFNNGNPLDLPIVRGGAGNDVVSFDMPIVGDITRIGVDLARFAMYSPAPFGSSWAGYINALVFDVEGLIASDRVSAVFEGTDGNERFIGLSRNDTLVGRGGDDVIFGGGGADLIEGGDGDDLIHPGASGTTAATSDTVDGGDGIDTLTFVNARPETKDGSIIAGLFGGVRVMLSDGIRVSVNTRGPDGEAHGAFGRSEIYEIENLVGSQGDDILIGNRGDNALAGNDGDDTLLGRDGDDVLGGGAGRNLLIGGPGDDTFLVSEGDASVVGGGGFDSLNFAGRPGAVSVNLTTGSWAGTLDTNLPVWNDTGTTEARLFNGVSMTPRDVLETDPIFANDAGDLTRVLPDTDDYAADPGLPRFEITEAQVGLDLSGEIAGVEAVIGTGGDDTLTGSAGHERLDGDAGNDTLRGNQGNDTLIGGGGRDVIFGDGGAAATALPDLLFLNEGGSYGPDYLSVSGFADMPTTALTMEALVKLEDTSGQGVGTNVYTIMSYAVGTIYNAFTVITTDTTVENSERYLRIIINNQVVNTTVPVAAFYDGDVHGLSVEWDGLAGFVRISLDGVTVWNEVGIPAAQTTLAAGGTLVFGQDQDNLGGGFSSLQDLQGGIGDIRLWDGTRTTGDIAADAFGPVGPADYADMAGYWQVDAAGEALVAQVGPALTVNGDVRFEDGGAALASSNDVIEGGLGADTIEGGDGADTIDGGDQDDVIDAGDGHDDVTGGNGRDSITLGKGHDIFRDNDQVQFGEDTVLGNGGKDTILGGGGNDSLDGQFGADSVSGGDGDDYVGGGQGDDTLEGGVGNDTVEGGDGRDAAWLGDGDDLFIDNTQGGVSGRDTVYAGAGDDTIGGGAGDDLFYGQDGSDSVLGRLGNDTLYGGQGDDTLVGGGGDDVAAGGNGRDRGFLGDGNDLWFDTAQTGEFGRDAVFGGTGDDTINAGGGDDTLYGEGGADTFVFAASIDRDTVADYAVGVDALQIDSALWGGPLTQARLNTLSDTSTGTLVLDFGGGDSITFEGLASNAGLLSDITLV